MISFNVKTSNGNLRVQGKTSWDEVTVREWKEIEKMKDRLDPITLFSILTGMEFELLANSKDDKLLETLYEVTKFIFNAPDWDNLPCPKKLEIAGKYYDVPKDLTKINFGQKILLTQLEAEEQREDAFVKAVAIVMLEEVYGSYTKESEKNLEALEELILDEPIVRIFGAGRFFFLNSPILLNIGANYLTKYQAQIQEVKE